LHGGVGVSAESGNDSIKRITKSINNFTEYIKDHRKEVKAFFDEAVESAHDIFSVIWAIGKAMVEVFSSRALRILADVIKELLIPALKITIVSLGALTNIMHEFMLIPAVKEVAMIAATFYILGKALMLVSHSLVMIQAGFKSILAHPVIAAIAAIAIAVYLLDKRFHILVAVPKRPSELPSEDELLRRLDSVSGATLTASKARQMFDLFRKAKDEAGALAFRQSIWKRFYDVSEFMKLLKQRYTQWHNRRHQRKGTLWEERFKSVLVDPSGPSLATLAAYIDLNRRPTFDPTPTNTGSTTEFF
jgi:hypothetical protein